MIRSVTKLLAGAAVLLFLCSSAGAETAEDLRSELDAISMEIADARAVAGSNDSDAVRQVAQMRLEVLELSRALIRNRIYVLEGDYPRRIVVSEMEPDEARARELLSELGDSADRVSDAMDDVEALSGVERSLAQVRLQTERLAHAQLSLVYLQAKHGIPIPALPSSASSPVAEPTSDSAPQQSARGGVSGIDANDDSPLLRRELARGAAIEGWWTFVLSPDGSSLAALNHSAYGPGIDGSKSGSLIGFECGAGVYGLSVLLPGMTLDQEGSEAEVVYRIGGGEPRFDRWAILPGGQGAVSVGREAYDLLRRMTRADEIVFEVWDSENSLHTGSFDLDGTFEVSLRVDQVCGSAVAPIQAADEESAEPEIEFARQDYRLIQTLLNIAGFSAGGADGIWGPRSQSAMRQYQHSAGLPETGHPDRDVLELLGLE